MAYSIGNPEFWIIKIHNQIHPQVLLTEQFFILFSMCFLNGIEYFKNIDKISKNSKKIFIIKFILDFLLLITIGIITSFFSIRKFSIHFINYILYFQVFYTNEKKNRLFLLYY